MKFGKSHNLHRPEPYSVAAPKGNGVHSEAEKQITPVVKGSLESWKVRKIAGLITS